MIPESKKQICPIVRLLENISKKWTLLILKSIMNWAISYSDIERQVDDINPSILSARLKELQDIWFIDKRVISDSPVKIEYHLTKKWKSFEPILDNITDWAMQEK